MQLIQTVTVGSGGAASITFGSGGTIPQTYTDLYIVISSRSTADNAGIVLAFNTGGTYTRKMLLGTGSSVLSNSPSTDLLNNPSAATASTFFSGSVYIPNYTSSNAKSYSTDSVSENNATLAYQAIRAGLWSGTAAITTIILTPDAGNFAEYSSASLYGITAGTDGVTTVS